MLRSALLFAPGLLLALVSAVSLGGGTLLADNDPTPSPSPSPIPWSSPIPSPTPGYDVPAPSGTPVPTSTPAPTTVHLGPLKEGDWVQVTGTGSCLNVRTEPTLSVREGVDPLTSILNCLPDGFFARLGDQRWMGEVTPPVFADGHWWWYLLGQGWAAEDWLAFHHEGGIAYPPRPDLAGSGLIAYIGPDQSVWVMNADGSGQHVLVARSGEEYFSELAWSADGTLLAFSVARPGTDPAGTQAVRVVNEDGVLIGEYAGLVSPAWSPSSHRIAALRVIGFGDMMGYHSTPVVLDLATGAETPVGPHSMYTSAPSWSPDGASLVFVCTSTTQVTYNSDGSSTETRIDCGGDGMRVVSADGSNPRVVLPFDAASGSGYTNPSWSPNRNVISLGSHWGEQQQCRGKVLFSLDTGGVTNCFPLPQPGGFGGRCGGPEDVAVDWTPNGSKLIYHTEFGAGRNGVFVIDVATGAETVVPFAPAWYVSVSADGAHLAFAGAGYIWVADTDGSGLASLAEGSAPAWQPR